MSAICGIYDTSGAPADENLLFRMREIASCRGPDGSGSFLKDGVGLAHSLLWNTPESVGERQPTTNGRDLWIVADARIDNRRDLDAAFTGHDGWPYAAWREGIPDTVYILRAYELWRGEAPLRLLGDFAFAIWDESNRTLFCARDPLGVKPFVYFWDGKKFLFGSEPKQILEDSAVSRELNLAHLGEMLIKSFSNREETPYRSIRRLPPGCVLRARQGSFEISSYWNWDPDKEPVSKGSLEDNAERFRTIFEEAVRCRLRVPPRLRTGSLLSGGMDSSSIVSVAAGMKPVGEKALPVFTIHFDATDSSRQIKGKDPVDESFYSSLIIDHFVLEAHELRIDRQSPIDDLKENLRIQDGPLFFPNLAYFQMLFRQVSAAGVRALLHGEGGDEIFALGPSCVPREFWRGHWRNFFKDALGERRSRGVRFSDQFWSVLRAAAPVEMRRFLRRIKGTVPDWIRPEFIAQIGLRERSRKNFYRNIAFYTSQSYGIHFWLQSGLTPLYLEVLDRAASAAAVEIRLPFLDLRLLKWMATVPWWHKRSGGVRKFILRKAMKGILPPQVCERSGKTEFSPAIVEMLSRHADHAIRESFQRPHPVLRQIIDPCRVRGLYEEFFSPDFSKARRPRFELLWNLWYTLSIDQWLKVNSGEMYAEKWTKEAPCQSSRSSKK